MADSKWQGKAAHWAAGGSCGSGSKLEPEEKFVPVLHVPVIGGAPCRVGGGESRTGVCPGIQVRGNLELIIRSYFKIGALNVNRFFDAQQRSAQLKVSFYKITRCDI